MFFKRYLAELVNLMVLTGRRTSIWPEQLKFKVEETNITQYHGMSCAKFFCMQTAIWSLPYSAGFCGLCLPLDLWFDCFCEDLLLLMFYVFLVLCILEPDRFLFRICLKYDTKYSSLLYREKSLSCAQNS